MPGDLSPVAQLGTLCVVAVAMLRRGRGGHRWPRAIAGWALCLAVAVAAWIPADFANFFFPIFVPFRPFSFADLHPALAGSFSMALLIASVSILLEIGRSAPASPVTAAQTAEDRDAETDDGKSPSRTPRSAAAR
jgi:hypothetical protein